MNSLFFKIREIMLKYHLDELRFEMWTGRHAMVHDPLQERLRITSNVVCDCGQTKAGATVEICLQDMRFTDIADKLEEDTFKRMQRMITKELWEKHEHARSPDWGTGLTGSGTDPEARREPDEGRHAPA